MSKTKAEKDKLWGMGFKRYDDEWSSTLRCPCGATFTWESFDERLDAWKAEHTPHLEDGKGGES